MDANAAVGQYVRVNEYAWATGNTLGNQESISIEMCNLTLSPDWQVAEITWREAARLCGWLHAKIIGVRPTRTTCKVHKDWKATICAGPHIDTVLNTMIADAQDWYDYFVAAPVPPPPPPPDPPLPPPPPPPPPPDPVYEVGYVAPPDDPALPTPWTPPVPSIWVPGSGRLLEVVVQEVLDGKWGGMKTRRTLLASYGYDPEEIRLEVNSVLHATGQLRMFKRKMHLG